MSDPDSPIPLSSVFLFGILFALSVWMTVLMTVQYLTVFSGKADFVTFSPLALIFPALVLLMGLLLCEAYLRNIRKTGAPGKRFKDVGKYLLYLSVVCLFAGPIVIRPAMKMYLVSEGYNYCAGTRSVLQKTLSQNWAKPNPGCEIWELSSDEREASK